jgi:hypothetical protein
VPEGEGLALEDLRNDQRVAVASDGRAAFKRIACQRRRSLSRHAVLSKIAFRCRVNGSTVAVASTFDEGAFTGVLNALYSDDAERRERTWAVL